MSSTGSDFILNLVIGITILFGFLGLLLLGLASAYRYSAIYQQYQYEKFNAQWFIIFTRYLERIVFKEKDDQDRPHPVLPRNQRQRFLEYWCIMHAHVSGSGDDALNALAEDVQMKKWITPYLKDRKYRTRIAALTAMGYTRQASKAQQRIIIKACSEQDGLLSITALRALIGIAPTYGLKVLSEQLPKRYWSDSRLTSVLQEAPYEQVIETLSDIMRTAPKRTALVCFRLCEQLSGYTSPHLSRLLFERFGSADKDIVMQFLSRVNVPALTPEVTPLLSHPDASIRSAAVIALSHIADYRARQHFITAVEDPNNWVRYQAITSLFHLPGMTPDMLKQIGDQIVSEHARKSFDEINTLIRMSDEALS